MYDHMRMKSLLVIDTITKGNNCHLSNENFFSKKKMSCQTLSNKFLEDINNLYDITDDYNVKIQVGEESKMEVFKAHSVILRARSNYFRTAFSSDWAKKEGDFYIFKKPNVSGIIFRIILK